MRHLVTVEFMDGTKVERTVTYDLLDPQQSRKMGVDCRVWLRKSVGFSIHTKKTVMELLPTMPPNHLQ